MSETYFYDRRGERMSGNIIRTQVVNKDMTVDILKENKDYVLARNNQKKEFIVWMKTLNNGFGCGHYFYGNGYEDALRDYNERSKR